MVIRMKPYKIISAEKEHFEECVVAIREAFEKSALNYGFTKENYPTSGAFIRFEDLMAAKERKVHMYIAIMDEKIIGYVQLEKKGDGVYSFQKFAVKPEHRQLGVGAALILFCKNKAKIYGGKKIKLIMVNKNEQLKEYYKANGFEFVGTKSDEFHPFEQGVMEMDLV